MIRTLEQLKTEEGKVHITVYMTVTPNNMVHREHSSSTDNVHHLSAP